VFKFKEENDPQLGSSSSSSESEHEDYNIPRFEKGPGPDQIIVVPELAKSES